ncbi:SGNH/GDSL hydrolase family protein [Mesorhizobium onobrychidis]|uniref:SGNH hydrolase-type esterase domain-containing protein n=1 Tax=Mesorhizobium onobrychidis TaxID=2775404 RepID=A0ABY5R4L6_9HYPH|nr:GDSL-type esterase/lipase family protein [Mesorhizobium onobrychidis]UVC18440.1 hypothetical protein IHQ72_16020 [Mesorhizobium onobrychidis]
MTFGKVVSKSKLTLRKILGTSRADREAELLDALKRASSQKLLLLGDSLIEASQAGIGNPSVARGAYGGSRIADVLAAISRIKGAFLWNKVAGAVVSIGVNDAQASEGDDLGSRQRYFRSALDALAHSVGDRPLVLLTITEIASAGTLVPRFNRDLIALQNKEIRSVKNAQILDIASQFETAMSQAGVPYDDGFRDGVHLSPAGYLYWNPLVEEAIAMVAQPR